MTRSLVLGALLVSSLCFAQGKVKMNGMEVVPSTSVLFETGSAKLKPESEAALAEVKAYLDDKTYITTMRIEGHVQAGVSGAQKLSEARAIAVGKWLISKGVDCKRLLAVGFGETKPAFEVAAQNSRVVFVNAALREKAVGGMPLDGGGRVAGDLCK